MKDKAVMLSKIGPWANLILANLRGADLYEADLTWADLSEAVWDEKTIWPEGFAVCLFHPNERLTNFV